MVTSEEMAENSLLAGSREVFATELDLFLQLEGLQLRTSRKARGITTPEPVMEHGGGTHCLQKGSFTVRCDDRRRPPRLSFRIFATNWPGRRKDERQRQVAFSSSFWRFRGNHTWQPGLTQHKHTHVEFLGKFGVTKMSEDFDDNQTDYCYACAFCQAEVVDGAALKVHIESVHLDELFKFPCEICGFNAEGPRFLREHMAAAHDMDDILSVVTVALENREVVTLEIVSMSDSDSHDDEMTPSTRNCVPARDGLCPLLSMDNEIIRVNVDYRKALDNATDLGRIAE